MISFKSNILSHNNIQFFFIATLAILLPFHNRIITYQFGVWGIYLTIFILKERKISINKNWKNILILPLYLVILLLSLLYTDNLKNGLKILETHSLFLILPFFMSISTEKFSRKKIILLNIIYIISLVIYISISIIVFFDRTSLNDIIEGLNSGTKYFQFTRYYNLSFIQHPSYIGLYLTWGIILITNLFNYFNNKWIRIVFISLIIIFILYIWSIASRASLVTLFILLVFYIIKSFVQNKRILFLISGIIILSLLAYSLVQFSRIKITFSEYTIKESLQKNTRVQLWNEGVKMFMDKPLIGYGVGDYKYIFTQKFSSQENPEIKKYKLNAHNQFIETSLQAGIIGLIVLCIIFIKPFLARKGIELYTLFFIIIFMNLFFESMFVRLAGNLFFTFWYSLIILFFNSVNKYEKR